MTSASSPFVVVGGAGRTGRLVVDRLRRDGTATRVLSRHAAERDGVETVTGSITDPAAVRLALHDAAAVVVVVESAAGNTGANPPEQVHHGGMRTVLAALEGRQVPVVLVSQIYITRPEAYPEVADTIAARGRAEQELRRSGLPYTIVRPSWLTDEPPGRSGLRLEQGDRGDGQVARADVAETVVQALRTPSAAGKTFELYAVEGLPPADWPGLFAALAPDPVEPTRAG